MTLSTPVSPLRVALLIGSVRQPRMADALATWLHARLSDVPGWELDVIDLAEADLPAHGLVPGGAPSPVSGRLAAADAFVVLTPEYNHSFPAALKHAIDWHHTEWARKPVAFVGYGAGAGGARAVEQLRQVFPELRATTVRDAVLLRQPWERLSADGEFQPDAGEEAALDATAAELSWWARALQAARAGVQGAAR